MKHNRRFLLTPLLLVMLTPACGPQGIAPENQDSRASDVYITWSFNGWTCAQLPGIDSVKVEIGGEPLENSGVFPCHNGDRDGVVLARFNSGRYSYKVTAQGAHGTYQTSGEFQVDPGDTHPVVMSLDLRCLFEPTAHC